VKLIAKKNLLLERLPLAVTESLLPHLQLIELERGVPSSYSTDDGAVYFPVNCVFAMSSQRDAGCSSFQTFVTSASVIGLIRKARLPRVHYKLQVVGSGYLLRGPYEPVWDSIDRASLGQSLVFDGLTEIAHIATINSECTSSHNCSERLARLILEARDALGADRDITISQMEYASLLRTRRETVTEILSRWIKSGIVAHTRAKIRVIDHDRLRQLSCDCYVEAKQAKTTAWQSLRGMAS
jgi:hypothetical protein